jgi:hypothetical protein
MFYRGMFHVKHPAKHSAHQEQDVLLNRFVGGFSSPA